MTNENLPTVTFTYTQGGTPYMTVKVTNPNIAGNISASDDWQSPVT